MATACSPKRRIPTRDDQPLHTIASYRKTFRLLLRFVQQLTASSRPPPTSATSTRHRSPPSWTTSSTTAATIRGPATRGWRAIRSPYHYAAMRHPEHAETIARVLAILSERHDRAMVNYSPRTRPQ